jgi:hypothetical protein
MGDDLRPRGGPGCLGLVIGTVVLAAVVGLVLVVGLVALGVVAGLFVVALLAVAVDRLLLAISPKRRRRRQERVRPGAVFTWQFGRLPNDRIIDATAVDSPPVDATAIESTGAPDGPPTGHRRPGPPTSA